MPINLLTPGADCGFPAARLPRLEKVVVDHEGTIELATLTGPTG
jgi:hypothetical protein